MKEREGVCQRTLASVRTASRTRPARSWRRRFQPLRRSDYRSRSRRTHPGRHARRSGDATACGPHTARGRDGYSISISAIQQAISLSGMEWVRALLIVDLLRLDDEAARRTGDGGVQDPARAASGGWRGDRRSSRPAGPVLSWEVRESVLAQRCRSQSPARRFDAVKRDRRGGNPK
jgi:hypothetical protein